MHNSTWICFGLNRSQVIMKRYLLGLVLVLGILGAYQIFFKPISFRSELAVVGDVMSQLGTLRGLLEEYRDQHGEMPVSLKKLETLNSPQSLLSAINFRDINSGKTMPWIYYRDGVPLGESRVYVLSPISFNSNNSELKKQSKELNYRIALFESGKIDLIEGEPETADRVRDGMNRRHR